MHQLLDRLLKHRGIGSPLELNPEERATFDEYQSVLSKEELTLEDVKQFCASQVEIIEAKWTDYALESERKSELLPYYTVYKSILNAITAPKLMREAVEQQLIQLTK